MYQDGDYGWAAFNTAMAVSDVFLLNSIRKGIIKGGLKAMGKNYGSWTSYRRFYGQKGFAEEGQHLHHWFWARNGSKKGTGLSWKLKNQMWNLKVYPSKASHMRWGHGKGFPSLNLDRIKYWKWVYPVRSTPTWFKSGIGSGGLRIYENLKRDE